MHASKMFGTIFVALCCLAVSVEAIAYDPCITAKIDTHQRQGRVVLQKAKSGYGYYTSGTFQYLGKSSDAALSLIDNTGTARAVQASMEQQGYALVNFYYKSGNTYVLAFKNPVSKSKGLILVEVVAKSWEPALCDNDLDGLADSWEIQQFNSLSQTGSGDPDGDKQTNLTEYVQGTNPTRANSVTATIINANLYEYDALGRVKRIMSVK